MLQINSSYTLEEMAAALRRAAQRHGGSILAVSNLGSLLREHQLKTTADAVSLTVCQPDLYAALLAADVRFAAFLPCRVAVYAHPGGVTLETIPPREFCRLLNRPDLERLAAPRETLLREILDEAATSAPTLSRAAAAERYGGLGATEDQVSSRSTLPQRIDCKGSKVEDLAGTGEHDSPGG
jgi:uncharacterized protein (DUF302 family)